MPCAEDAVCWLVGPVHKVANSGTQGSLGLVLAHWWVELDSRRIRAVTRQLGVGKQVLELVPTHWWVEPGLGGWLQVPGITMLVLDHCLVRRVLYTVGYSVQDIPKILFACLWAGLSPNCSQVRVWAAGGWARFTGCKSVVLLWLVSAPWWVNCLSG